MKKLSKTISFFTILLISLFFLTNCSKHVSSNENSYTNEEEIDQKSIIQNQILTSGCDKSYGRNNSPASFQGILPEKSSLLDVEKIFGKAIIHEGVVNYWEYHNLVVTHDATYVKEIRIYDNLAESFTIDSVSAIYGCPDILLAYDTSEDMPSQNWDTVIITYIDNGIEISFHTSHPINIYKDKANIVVFFPSMSIDEYLVYISPRPSGKEYQKMLSWDEATTE